MGVALIRETKLLLTYFYYFVFPFFLFLFLSFSFFLFTLSSLNQNIFIVRVSIGGREVNAKREFQVPGSYREKKTKELFSFLRFIHAKDSELMLLGQSDGFKVTPPE